MATLGGEPPIPPYSVTGAVTVYLAIIFVFAVFATTAVTLRFMSRRLNRSTGLDDWLSLGALVFIYAFGMVSIVGARYGGGGHHTARLTTEQLEIALKVILSSDIFHNTSVSLSKFAMLVLYRRIFTVRSFRPWFWIFCFIVFGQWISAVCGLIFSYYPVDALWHFWETHTSIHCKAFWVTMAAINTCIDLAILCLPQPYLWKLHLSCRRRLLLSLLIFVGLFTTCMSVLRIVFLARLVFNDVTHSITLSGYWAVLEASLSVICGCAPTFPSLFQHWSDRANSTDNRSRFEKWNSSGASSLTGRKRSATDSLDIDYVSQVSSVRSASRCSDITAQYHDPNKVDVEILQTQEDGSDSRRSSR